jgi:hypothetical protein
MNSQEKKPNLKDLINDFIAIKKLNIPRLNILNLQLYAEHYVNEIILTQINEIAREEVKKYISFPQKLRILKKMKILDEKQLKILEILNKIRDEMVHELVLENASIEAKLKYTKFDFIYGWGYINKDKKRINKIFDLNKIYKKVDNNFDKLFISSVLIIGILYNNYKILNQENVKQFIDIVYDKNSQLRLVVKEIT